MAAVLCMWLHLELCFLRVLSATCSVPAFLFSYQEFNLIDRRELAPLQELIEKLGSKDR